MYGTPAELQIVAICLETLNDVLPKIANAPICIKSQTKIGGKYDKKRYKDIIKLFPNTEYNYETKLINRLLCKHTIAS